jgi:signal transduction histidine kinase
LDLRAAVHDLRAPLNAMALNLELLRTRLEKDEALGSVDKCQYLRYVETLTQEVGRLASLLQGVQSRLDASAST